VPRLGGARKRERKRKRPTSVRIGHIYVVRHYWQQIHFYGIRYMCNERADAEKIFCTKADVLEQNDALTPKLTRAATSSSERSIA